VTGRINNHVVPCRGFERNLCRIDGDVLFLFLEQGIEEKGKFELHVLRRAGALYLVEFPFRQRIRVAQDATDKGGLAMIDVADKDDAQRRLAADCRSLDGGCPILEARLSFAHFLIGSATRESLSPATSAWRCAHGGPGRGRRAHSCGWFLIQR